jgi:hypothetical protein
LYGGVVVFALLAALTARSIWRAWTDRAGQARAEAVFNLVQQRTPSRPTEAPGAMAWLRDQLAAYRRHLPDPSAPVFERLAHAGDEPPAELARVVVAMRHVAEAASAGHPPVRIERLSDREPSRRAISLVTAGEVTLVVTRRRALELDPSSNEFVSRLAWPMATAKPAVEQALAAGIRPVRLYALADDGTLLSLPWGSSNEPPDSVARLEAVHLSSRPTLPSFAPEEFFFTFGEAEREAVKYSGFYLDLGGRGLVSTFTVPIEHSDRDGVLAIDLAHAIDWEHFASTIASPLSAGIAHLPAESAASWTMFRESLPASAARELHEVLARIASGRERPDESISPISHRVVTGLGAVAAFQVAERTWLLTFFPNSPPSFPLRATALLAVVLVTLLAGFEVNRRRAEREADRAARALQEKQNLLNTMQVPLMVVDPNTDVVVSANQAAESIGIRRGARFIDRISRDPRARAHYERMQVATADPRRAYGIPILVEGPAGPSERLAIVRSVAVTAPIEALGADERHRLGILFLVDPRSDLSLLIEDVDAAAHRDERKRLAGLLSHGLDALVQVLQGSLSGRAGGSTGLTTAGSAQLTTGGSTGPTGGSTALTAWLAEYLERRIQVTAWLLDHWDQPPPVHDAVVDAAQAVDTLSSLERIFAEVRTDTHIRSRLGWTNGPLSVHGEGATFTTRVDWPADVEMTLPVRGGLGFFLTEVLSNAMRHGAPGCVPEVVVECDRVRKELKCSIENAAREERGDRGHSAYGGLAILEGMSRLFGWTDFTAAPAGGRFVVSWRAALTRRDAPGKPD